MGSNRPDPIAYLNDAERRLYDLACTSVPLAEIAVRLGMPVGDAHSRLESLLRKLNVPNRAALRERAAAPAPPPEPLAARVAGLPAVGVGHPAEPPTHTLSRRRLLAGAAVGLAGAAASAGGVLVVVSRRGGQNDVPAQASAAPTTNPQGAPIPTPTPTTKPAATWDNAIFDSDQPIDWDHGLFSINVHGGSISLWKTEGDIIVGRMGLADARDIPTYSLTQGGRFIIAELYRETRVFDRDTGESRSRPKQDANAAMLAGDDSRFVFLDLPERVCRVTDTRLNPVWAFDLPRQVQDTSADRTGGGQVGDVLRSGHARWVDRSGESRLGHGGTLAAAGCAGGVPPVARGDVAGAQQQPLCREHLFRE